MSTKGTFFSVDGVADLTAVGCFESGCSFVLRLRGVIASLPTPAIACGGGGKGLRKMCVCVLFYKPWRPRENWTRKAKRLPALHYGALFGRKRPRGAPSPIREASRELHCYCCCCCLLWWCCWCCAAADAVQLLAAVLLLLLLVFFLRLLLLSGGVSDDTFTCAEEDGASERWGMKGREGWKPRFLTDTYRDQTKAGRWPVACLNEGRMIGPRSLPLFAVAAVSFSFFPAYFNTRARRLCRKRRIKIQRTGDGFSLVSRIPSFYDVLSFFLFIDFFFPFNQVLSIFSSLFSYYFLLFFSTGFFSSAFFRSCLSFFHSFLMSPLTYCVLIDPYG